MNTTVIWDFHFGTSKTVVSGKCQDHCQQTGDSFMLALFISHSCVRQITFFAFVRSVITFVL